MHTEEVNKIALCSNDDKRMQTFDKITTYPYGTNAFMVCRNEMLLKNKVMCDQVKYMYIYIFFSIKMGKTEVENLDFKNKLNIVLGIIANAKKDLESLKTEINDVKSDREMFKKDLNSFNNEFSEYLKDSLKVTDNLIKIDNDVLMTLIDVSMNFILILKISFMLSKMMR